MASIFNVDEGVAVILLENGRSGAFLCKVIMDLLDGLLEGFKPEYLKCGVPAGG